MLYGARLDKVFNGVLMRHAVLAATLAFGSSLRPRGVVPIASRRVGRAVLNWLDRRRQSADASLSANETELWVPPSQDGLK